MAHRHSVYDTDAHFKINAITRAITNDSSSKTALIQGDHNSERFTFEVPRVVDGHDLSLCNAVEIHYINIDSGDKTKTSADAYDVDDLQTSPTDEDVVILSWLISRNATKYAGSLNFLVKFKCVDDAGEVVYEWNTAIYTGISVSSGIDNGEVVAEMHSDILAQWEIRIKALEEGDTGAVSEAIAEYVDDVCIVKNQGSANVGKILVVGTDGNLMLMNMPEGGGGSGDGGTASGDVIGVIDGGNNILLSGNLADGTYTLKYENEDGTYTEVGTLQVGDIPEPEEIENLLDTAWDVNLGSEAYASGSATVYNGVGYMEGRRVSNSGGGEGNDGSASQKCTLTGLIPLGNDGDVLHFSGVDDITTESGHTYSGIYSCWDADGAFIAGSVKSYYTDLGGKGCCNGIGADGKQTLTIDHSKWILPEGTAYIRLQVGTVTGDFIITRNQDISV